MRLFANRSVAAEELARHLAFLQREDPVVLGLVNGGVPMADIIGRRLDASRDVMLMARLAAPGTAGRTVGAVDEHGRISLIRSSARWHHLTSQEMVGPARLAFRSLQTAQAKIRAILPEIDVRGRTVILVDEGVESGARLLGAVESVRDRGAERIVVSVPAGTSDGTWQLHDTADIVVIPHRPSRFTGIECLYEQYQPVTEECVCAYAREWSATRSHLRADVQTRIMSIENSRGDRLCCAIDMPPDGGRDRGPRPAVVFAHGMDSDANSPRNVPVSRRLATRGIIGVRMNYTGHGASGGLLEHATPVQCLQDLDRVCQTIYGLREVDSQQLGIVGSGVGGMLALHYAARVPQVRTLVIRDAVCGDESDAARRVHVPVLLIHAAFERPLEAGMAILQRALAGTHETLCIAESNRLYSDPVSRELMVNATVEWMIDHLGDDRRAPSSSQRDATSSP